MFRHELSMLAQAIAEALDLHDDGMVEQTIEQRRGHDGIAEHVPHSAKPRLEVRIMAPRSSARSQVGKKIVATGHDREVADLVDDQHRGAGKEPDALVQTPFALGSGELPDQVDQGAEIDASARLKKLVTPAARREAVAHLRTSLGVSERRAGGRIEADRTSIRYRSRRGDDTALRMRLRELAQQRRRYGLPAAAHPASA